MSRRHALVVVAALLARASVAHAGEPRPSERIGLPKAYRPNFSQLSEAWVDTEPGEVVFSGLLTFGAELDLGELGWIDGATVGVTGLGIQGGNIALSSVGDAGIASNIAGVSTVRLFRAWYGQRLASDAVDVKAGIIALDDDFMVLEQALLFINSGFGTAQTLALNSPAPIYPLGALGARVSIRATDEWSFQIGAYDGDAGDPFERRQASQLKWTDAGGAILLGEVRYQTSVGGRELDLALGGFGQTGRFRDHERDGLRRGLGSGYVMAEHAVARWSSSTLWLLAHAGIAAPLSRAVAPLYTDAAAVIDGGAWHRPDDRLGLGIAWTAFGRDYVAWRRSGGPGREPTPTTPGEAVLELTYQAAVTSWLGLQPDFQWHRRPRDGADDAYLLGIRVALTP